MKGYDEFMVSYRENHEKIGELVRKRLGPLAETPLETLTRLEKDRRRPLDWREIKAIAGHQLEHRLERLQAYGACRICDEPKSSIVNVWCDTCIDNEAAAHAQKERIRLERYDYKDMWTWHSEAVRQAVAKKLHADRHIEAKP